MRWLGLLAFLTCLWMQPNAQAQDFRLPIDCSLGDACIVQNYADANPAAGAADDPTCGPLSYDGHDGLDFRAPAALAARGVAVLAPAGGVVAGVRDGEPDGVFLGAGAAALAGRDCGNGLRIAHADGWESQLCHLRAGSLRVRAGERVEAGQPLGLVGLSGRTEFHHVHLTLRRNGEAVEPLTGGPLDAARCGEAMQAGSHWSAGARSALSYRGAQWFAVGFTGAAPAPGANAETLPANAARDAPALVFWALAIGPRDGDVLRVRLYGPGGALMAENFRNQPRDQAQAWLFAGRPAPAGGWAPGLYRGEAALLRGGRVVATRSRSFVLR